MPNRRRFRGVTLGPALASTALSFALLSGASAQSGPPAPSPIPAAMSANDRLNRLGPEGEELARRVGTWDATFTEWEREGAPPVTTHGLVAEREMIGSMLQERLHTLPGAPGPA